MGRLQGLSVEQRYTSANNYLLQLEHDTVLGRDRDNWLKGARNFRKIYLSQKKEPLGPLCLYKTGLLYGQMYDHFKFPLDLDNAIDHFTLVATLYPKLSLTDDALFAAAERLLVKKEKKQAMALYRKIVETYPNSDHSDKARARIRENQENRLPSPISPLPSPQKTTHLTDVEPIKYWSSKDYTRIVIQTAAPIHFNAGLLEKNGELPRRLYIDLSNTYIDPQFRNPKTIEDGLLKQIRSGQFSNDTVRVVLDIESLSEYKIFSLKNPFRVIVDIHGRMRPTGSVITPEPHLISQSPAILFPKTSNSTIKGNTKTGMISLEDQKKRRLGTERPARMFKPGHDTISLAQQLGLGVRKIVIDPGHGGKDPGAMAFNLKEKNIVLKISKKTAKILKAKYRYDVILTRTKDVYIPLEERIAIANTQNSDLFISIHINAHPDKTIGGIETYFLNLATNADAMRVAAIENATSTHNINELQSILTDLMKNSKIDESSRLAQFVQKKLVSGCGKKYRLRDLGVKQAPFFVLIGAEMPAILAEISFITNPQEAKLLQDDEYLNKMAQQIAAGIAAYVDHHHTAAVRF